MHLDADRVKGRFMLSFIRVAAALVLIQQVAKQTLAFLRGAGRKV